MPKMPTYRLTITLDVRAESMAKAFDAAHDVLRGGLRAVGKAAYDVTCTEIDPIDVLDIHTVGQYPPKEDGAA